MNIKELMEWRKDCFFCHEELAIVPLFGDGSTQFNIENDCLIVKSRFINFSIHIENGTLTDFQSDNLMSDDFINNSHLKITCKCLSCKSTGYYYEYSGKIPLSPLFGKQRFVFREKVVRLNDWFYCQIKGANDQWGILKTFKKNELIKAPTSKYELIGGRIITPFLDLKRLTPEKLENKLKTYIVFS